MINTLLGMSLAGSAVFLLWRLTDRLFRGRLPARWSYRMLKAALLFLLIPVGRLAGLLTALWPAPAATAPALPAPTVSAAPVVILPSPLPAAPAAPIPAPAPQAPPEIALSLSAFRLLAILWAAGAALALLRALVSYVRFRRRFLAGNRRPASAGAVVAFQACRRALGLTGRVELRENPAASSPFTTGLLRPVVVIPTDLALSPEELRCLFLHELTHIRCGDLWVKSLSLLARCVHWFNPLVLLLNRRIQEIAEQSCDERAAVSMDSAERYAYGSVILKFASGEAVSGQWAASLSTREAIERRLKRVLHVKKLKTKELVLILALSAALLAGGTAAAMAVREPLGLKAPEAPASDTKVTALHPSSPNGREASPAGGSSGTAAPLIAAPTGNSEEASPDNAQSGVSVDGHPSEAFLQKLRAHYAATCPKAGVTDDTPVLFGNAALILSRGGTLLPDEDFDSYTMTYGGSENHPAVIYKMFHTKNSGYDSSLHAQVNVYREEYFVGNPEALSQYELAHLDEDLVNGEYPKNSRGETYGSHGYSDYVGYDPDLMAAQGTQRESGYISRADERLANPNLPEEECPHEFLIPLYDKEHNEIGKFAMSCGGHLNAAERGLSIDEAKAILAKEENGGRSESVLAKIRKAWDAPADTPVLFGDRDLILSRGGTLLPDGDDKNYSMVGGALYKLFRGKDGIGYKEYAVGNTDLLDEYQKAALDQLVNGDYPKNSKGESYGSEAFFAEFVGYRPDLIAAKGEDGVRGYYREEDTPGYAEHIAHDIDAYNAIWKANPGPQPIPLYDSEGNVIGAYLYGGGYGPGDMGITSDMSIDEAKQAAADFLEKNDPPAGANTTTVGNVTITSWVDDTPNPSGHWTPFTNGDWEKLAGSALRGDAKLIKSVGGTVLPDDDKVSYVLYNGYFFKQYRGKDGGMHPENELRNPDWIDEEYRWVLDTLVNGEYAKNSQGETYGITQLAGYMGYFPDLCMDYWDIEDTHTLPADFSLYTRMTPEECRAYANAISFNRSSSAEINARTEALRNSV